MQYIVEHALTIFFSAKSLSAVRDSQITVDPPNVREVEDIRNWWEEGGRLADLQPISVNNYVAGTRENSNVRQTNAIELRKTFAQAQEERLGSNGRAAYFNVKSTITSIKHDMGSPPWYNACPNEKCKRKVKATESGGWFCEHCNAETPTCDTKFILSINANDHTGSSWLSGFDEVGTYLLGVDSQQLALYRDNGVRREIFLEFSLLTFFLLELGSIPRVLPKCNVPVTHFEDKSTRETVGR